MSAPSRSSSSNSLLRSPTVVATVLVQRLAAAIRHFRAPRQILSPSPISNDHHTLAIFLQRFVGLSRRRRRLSKFNTSHINASLFSILQSSFVSRLGIQRARSAPMTNGTSGCGGDGLFGQERDASEMDLNHRLESLCLSMTEHALEGANDN